MGDERPDLDHDVFDAEGAVDQESPSEDFITLAPAGLLTPAGVDHFRRWRPGRVIAIMGERKGGKTTLVTELFQRFVRGPFASSIFVDSRTLLGFSEKSFESRVESGNIEPDTRRTSVRDDLRFFHLGLARSDTPSERIDLLISERAGETYRAIRNRPDDAHSLVEVRHADFVLFVLDGERLSIDLLRNEVFQSTRSMLKVLADEGAIPDNASIQIVTTKFDYLLADEQKRTRDRLLEFEGSVTHEYRDHPGGIAAFRTSARGASGTLGPAWGVDRLLDLWMTKRPTMHRIVRAPVRLPREIDRLLLRSGAA